MHLSAKMERDDNQLHKYCCHLPLRLFFQTLIGRESNNTFRNKNKCITLKGSEWLCERKNLLSFSAAFSLWVMPWEWYQNVLSYFHGKNPWAISFLIKLALCQANVKHWFFDSVFSIVLIALGCGEAISWVS